MQVTCEHPNCTAQKKNARVRYCDEHMDRAYVVQRWRANRTRRKLLGQPKGYKHCETCGELFKMAGGNQRFCDLHRSQGKARRNPYRPGVMYLPPGAVYNQWSKAVESHGISMSTYCRRRRNGFTHIEALYGRIPSHMTSDQRRVNELLKSWHRSIA